MTMMSAILFVSALLGVVAIISKIKRKNNHNLKFDMQQLTHIIFFSLFFIIAIVTGLIISSISIFSGDIVMFLVGIALSAFGFYKVRQVVIDHSRQSDP